MSAPFERILFFDFETRWGSKDYTLSKMTTEEYVRDPRFKAFGFGYKWQGDKSAHWVGSKHAVEWLAEVDWSTTAVCCHNAMFDCSILSWCYDVHPCFILDTLSMARALYGVEAGNSAAKLAIKFGLPPKGTAVHSTDGLETLTRAIEEELAEYCKHDVDLCEAFYDRMAVGYPPKELRLIDMTVKMFTEPRLVLDRELLQQAVDEEATKRTALLKRLGATDKDIGNNDKMACFLAELGVKAPKKRSPTNPENMIYAFAKKDAGFQQLLNSENEDVVALCETRLMVKSSSERTRATRLLGVAERGPLPVPLIYGGAHTGRWSGTQGINLQNLKRGGPIRRAMMAPDGYQIVVMDLSQIEPRVLASLADYDDLLNIFRSGEDAYSIFGRQSFNMPALNKKDNPELRQAAKAQMLGCGFQIAFAAFAGHQLVGFLGAPPVRYDKKFARSIGVDSEYVERFLDYEKNIKRMMEIPRTCTDEELLIHCVASKKVVDNYRGTAVPVTDLWKRFDKYIEESLYGGAEIDYKCLTFSKEKVRLPNGMYLKYPNLRRTKDDEGRAQWVYGERDTKLYSGRLTENVVQAVARIVMSDGMLRTQKRYPVILTCHDEEGCLVPDEEAEEALVWTREQMIVEPSYLPGIPLDAEGGVAKRYGEAKS